MGGAEEGVGGGGGGMSPKRAASPKRAKTPQEKDEAKAKRKEEKDEAKRKRKEEKDKLKAMTPQERASWQEEKEREIQAAKDAKKEAKAKRKAERTERKRQKMANDIQRVFRGWMTRLWYEEELRERGAMRIQRNYRHHLLVVSSRAVGAVLKRREEEEAALRQRSVYKIQLAWHSHEARERVARLRAERQARMTAMEKLEETETSMIDASRWDRFVQEEKDEERRKDERLRDKRAGRRVLGPIDFSKTERETFWLGVVGRDSKASVGQLAGRGRFVSKRMAPSFGGGMGGGARARAPW